ncbi:hypothetical protein HMPREF9073_02864 [Capnocytophaga sp. oral taxon 326 str. F0382]|nr:hypothetical protein HMPREF9073_02864 [Capnocytophaga sp. oral taxon 326 str. F0382]
MKINSFRVCCVGAFCKRPHKTKPFSPLFRCFSHQKVAFTDCPPSGVRGQLLIINY